MKIKIDIQVIDFSLQMLNKINENQCKSIDIVLKNIYFLFYYMKINF